MFILRSVNGYYGMRYQQLINYSQIDQSIIKEFSGAHPQCVEDWLPKEIGVYEADSNYQLNTKQKKHRKMIKLELLFGLELSKKHYKLVK